MIRTAAPVRERRMRRCRRSHHHRTPPPTVAWRMIRRPAAGIWPGGRDCAARRWRGGNRPRRRARPCRGGPSMKTRERRRAAAAAPPPAGRLFVDGRDIGPTSGRPLALSAGTHVVMLRDDNQFSDTALVMIRGGEDRSLDLRTKASLSPASATEPPPEPAPALRLAPRMAAAPTRRAATTGATTATATLTMPLPPPAPASNGDRDGGGGSLLGRWWFWTAVGALAAGAATAAALTAGHRSGGGAMPSCPNATVAGC